jgi:hypothetical protein
VKKSRVSFLLESRTMALNERRPRYRDGVMVSSISVESPVKKPKREYIPPAPLRKLKDSSSTPLWEGYATLRPESRKTSS